MTPRDSLGKLLQCWQVKPPANPKFQAEIWKRMMPVMLPGQATHNKSSATGEQRPESCDFWKPTAKTDAQSAPATNSGAKPASPPSSEHEH